jgi:hypothetical protein
MFNWLVETFAPSSFTWGVMKYQRKEYESAKKCISRAIKWYPPLYEDPLIKAYEYLTEYRLGDNSKTEKLTTLFPKMAESEYKDNSSYHYAYNEMKNIIKSNI